MSSAPEQNGAPSTEPLEASLSTLAIHADDEINTYNDVAPALHVSTTFRYASNPDELEPVDIPNFIPDGTAPHVYSRATAPNTTRLETVLSSLLHGHALTYSSGLTAFHALLTYFAPRAVAIGGGYHGCHAVLGVHAKLHGLRKVNLGGTEADWDAAGLGAGDIVHVETPTNPTGEAADVAGFARRAHARGALLSVDATFGPPGLQEPFALGADVVMHSGTKYLGGHSDLLCGVLAVRKGETERWKGLWLERCTLGLVMGSLEGWLGVRSLRTLEVRVKAQSENAGRLVAWLDGALKGGREEGEGEDAAEAEVVRKVVKEVKHASLQAEDMHWLKKQMPNGFGPVFSIYMKTMQQARALPSKLRFFHHATSLGGVESLIEWRRMTDAGVDETMLRLSIGIENWVDLKNDLAGAFKAVAEMGN